MRHCGRTVAGTLLPILLLGASGVPSPPRAEAAIPNILVNDPTADAGLSDTQSTTALCLLPGGVILCAFIDTGSRAAGLHYTGIARSTDAGDTWLDQGLLPASTQGDGGWPSLARSAATNTVVLTTSTFDATGLLAFRSTDGGQSYQAPIDASGGSSVPDLAWIACDNFDGAGAGNFYLLFRDFNSPGGMAFTRSVDDGVSWAPKQFLTASTGQLAWVVVGADHAVYCFWLDRLGPNQYYLRKSTDRGQTFGPLTTVATLRTLGVNGDLGLNGDFRAWDSIQVVAHPTDPNQLYAIWADWGYTTFEHGDIFFSQTADGGATWSPTVRLNTDTGLNDQWQPVIAISPDGTTLFTSWYDRRLDPNNWLIDVYARQGSISGNTVTFTGDYRITDVSFPPVKGQDPWANAAYMGDYDMAAADDAMFYRTWGDNRLAGAAHPYQPDVRFTKVPKGPLMQAAGFTLSSESCAPANGALDPDETVVVALGLSNYGRADTGNLVATLQSSGGVISHSAPQNYGAVATGGSPVSREFSVTAVGGCGGTVIATLQLQDGPTDLGTVSYSFPLGVRTLFGTNTYSSGDLDVPVPASGTTGDMDEQTIHVSDTGSVGDVNVRVRLDHGRDSDLRISVVSPSGTTVVLSDHQGGTGENFGAGPNRCNGSATAFDDEANTSIGEVTAPFTGSHRPDEPLSVLDGTPIQGDWTLRINDGEEGQSGILGCWRLEITEAQSTCSSCPVTAVDDASTTSFVVWPTQPNPFTRETWIRYALPAAGPVELVVYDVRGRRVATLVQDVQSVGPHAVRFGPDAATASGERLGTLPNGVYFYRLRAGEFSTTRKMLLVK